MLTDLSWNEPLTPPEGRCKPPVLVHICTTGRDFLSDEIFAKPSLAVAQISGKCLQGHWLLFRQTSTVVWPIIASVACCTIVGFVCAL